MVHVHFSGWAEFIDGDTWIITKDSKLNIDETMRKLANYDNIVVSAVLDGIRTTPNKRFKYPIFKEPPGGGYLHVVHAIDTDYPIKKSNKKTSHEMSPMTQSWMMQVVGAHHSYPDSLRDWDYDYEKYLIHSNMNFNIKYLVEQSADFRDVEGFRIKPDLFVGLHAC